MLPLRDEFEKLFRSFFNVQENLKFLENISVSMLNFHIRRYKMGPT